jgi:hypothetical protein
MEASSTATAWAAALAGCGAACSPFLSRTFAMKVSTSAIVTQSYITIRATDKEVDVFYGDTNPQEAPAGFGKTLVEALGNFADELVKYNCDATSAELLDPGKALM